MNFLALTCLLFAADFFTEVRGLETSLCNEKLKDDIRKLKDQNPNHSVVAQPSMLETPKQCRIECQIAMSKSGDPNSNKLIKKGEFQSPDYSTALSGCGPDKVCMKGKCDATKSPMVDAEYCNRLMAADVEKAKKSGKKNVMMVPTSPNDNLCRLECSLQADGSEIKKQTTDAIDYKRCGVSNDKYKTINFCKKGKCVTVDGKPAK